MADQEAANSSIKAKKEAVDIQNGNQDRVDDTLFLDGEYSDARNHMVDALEKLENSELVDLNSQDMRTLFTQGGLVGQNVSASIKN